MHPYESNDNLLYLLTEKASALRQQTEESWQTKGHCTISPSEWNFMAKIYDTEQTVSELARSSDITRQAAHKFFRNLEAKGMLTIRETGETGHDRVVVFTEQGKLYYQRYLAVQSEIEHSIQSQLGEETILQLKNILQKDWALDTVSSR